MIVNIWSMLVDIVKFNFRNVVVRFSGFCQQFVDKRKKCIKSQISITIKSQSKVII